jgi:hypothetical protein
MSGSAWFDRTPQPSERERRGGGMLVSCTLYTHIFPCIRSIDIYIITSLLGYYCHLAPTHIWNMVHPQRLSTALFFVLCTLLLTAVLGNKKTGIFNKIADTTRDLQASATGGASALLGGAGRFSLEGFMDTFEELTDKQWGTPKTTLEFDLIGLMRDVFVKDEGHTRLLQEAWGDPEILRALMDDLPIFDVIKPLRALKEKKTLTSRDVRKLAN